MKWALFMMGEYISHHRGLGSARDPFPAPAGWHGPVMPPVVWFMLKTFAEVIFFIWVRGTFPLFRFDHSCGWLEGFLVPLSLVNILFTGAGNLIYQGLAMIIPFLKGLATTLRMVFTKPSPSINPEEKARCSPRWAGAPAATIDPDGRRSCVACNPVMWFVLPTPSGASSPPKGRSNEKYPVEFTIDLQRCIFCVYARRACPKGSIKLNDAY